MISDIVPPKTYPRFVVHVYVADPKCPADQNDGFVPSPPGYQLWEHVTFMRFPSEAELKEFPCLAGHALIVDPYTNRECWWLTYQTWKERHEQ